VEQLNIEYLRDKLIEFDNRLNIYKIDFQSIVFEERVSLNCFYCPKYNLKWTCPPKIPDLNYQKIISEYSNIAIISIDMLVVQNNLDDIRTESTNVLHKALLMLEKELWSDNNPLALSFIGGSCKLCKNGCGKDRCNQPGLSRIPIEAIGINVVESLKNVDVNIVFPIKDKLSRYGMLLW
jgi:predicted metal-binding protein